MIDIIITHHQWLLVPALTPVGLLIWAALECRS